MDQIDPALVTEKSFKLVGPVVFDLSYLLSVAGRVLQGTEPTGYLYEEDYFKELANAVVRTVKSEICRAGWQAGNSGRS